MQDRESKGKKKRIPQREIASKRKGKTLCKEKISRGETAWGKSGGKRGRSRTFRNVTKRWGSRIRKVKGGGRKGNQGCEGKV